MNSLRNLGFNTHFSNYILNHNISTAEIARVTRHDKNSYQVALENRSGSAILAGNYLNSTEANDLPVVGDWVKVVDFDDQFVIVDKLPRMSSLTRKSAGSIGRSQVMAANLDFALIIQGLDRDFNINRLERYITIAFEGGVTPIVVMSKSDLKTTVELVEIAEQIKNRLPDQVELIFTSSISRTGLDALAERFKGGQTLCCLGSSGAGKSTLANRLTGAEEQETGELSDSNQKGKHTTTSRHLIQLPGGAVIIDTPGMREIGLAGGGEGLEMSFETISTLSEQCRFADCSHQSEPGCAVIEAIEQGSLSVDQYENYLKLVAESNRFQKTKAEMNKEGKRFGKIIREAQANRRRFKS